MPEATLEAVVTDFSAPRAAKKMPTLAVGEPCLWYVQADTKTHPAPAQVVRAGGGGSLNIVWFDDNGYGHPLTGVRHVTDPGHTMTPRPEWSFRQGGWDFVKPGQDTIDRLKLALGLAGAPVGNGKPPAIEIAGEIIVERQPAPFGTVHEEDDDLVPAPRKATPAELDKLRDLYLDTQDVAVIRRKMGPGWTRDAVLNALVDGGIMAAG